MGLRSCRGRVQGRALRARPRDQGAERDLLCAPCGPTVGCVAGDGSRVYGAFVFFEKRPHRSSRLHVLVRVPFFPPRAPTLGQPQASKPLRDAIRL